VEEKIKYLSIGFGIGVFLCALVLGLIGKNKNIKEIHVPLIGTIKFLEREETHIPQIVHLAVEGEVRDIFDNPRRDIIVVLKGENLYGMTDQEGRFLISAISERETLDLEARYGNERTGDSIVVERDAALVKNLENGNGILRSYKLHKPLIIENPSIRIDALLCKRVGDHIPSGIFEGENPGIPSIINTVWCFIRVFGPLGYEDGKMTKLYCDWFLDGEFVHRHTLDVGFNPTSRGWRTNVYKNLNQQIGQWRIEIKSVYRTLNTLYFEVY